MELILLFLTVPELREYINIKKDELSDDELTKIIKDTSFRIITDSNKGTLEED